MGIVAEFEAGAEERGAQRFVRRRQLSQGREAAESVKEGQSPPRCVAAHASWRAATHVRSFACSPGGQEVRRREPRCREGRVPSGSHRGESVSLYFQNPGGHLGSWAPAPPPFTPTSCFHHQIPPRRLPPVRTLVRTLDPPNNPG